MMQEDREFTLSTRLRSPDEDAVDRQFFRVPELDLETVMNVACRRIARGEPVDQPHSTPTAESHCATGTVELCSTTTNEELSSSDAVRMTDPSKSIVSEVGEPQAVPSQWRLKSLVQMNDGSPHGASIAFRLHEQLGIGGTSLVYRAMHCESMQPVAIKFLSPLQWGNVRVRERFEREIKIMRVMRHPHVVTHIADGHSGEYRCYAMEFLERGTLADRLLGNGRLSIEQVLRLARQVCEALTYLHRHGIIHRDLKPANLFLASEDQVKVGDFGFAFFQGVERVSVLGRTCGTYAYMSPEQITTATPVTAQSDLYALGCTLFELLTGRTPFQADSQFEMLRQHLQDAPPPVRCFCPECPSGLEQLVAQLLKKSPKARPATARSVQTELGELARCHRRETATGKTPASPRFIRCSTEPDSSP